jgi:hypothetical protein
MAIISHGRVLLSGDPLETIERIRGRIWRKFVIKHQLGEYERDFAVISKRLIAGKTVIHVLADARPDASFEPVDANLEDVYFSTLNQAAKAA